MKKRLTFLVLFSCSIALMLSSCKDILSEDISDVVPQLLVPAVQDTVMVNPVLFKWEEMEGATKYRLQVVSPSFSAIAEYVLDTIIETTSFSYSLDSNVFELKLTAINSGYTSKTVGPVQFWVGISPSSSGSGSVVLQSPAAGVYVNSSFTGPFTWDAVTDATSYELSLRKGSSFETGTIELTQNGLYATTFALPSSITLTESTYFWGVKAYTSTGETVYATRKFLVDLTTPNVPDLTSPSSTTIQSAGTVTFVWSNGSDGGTIQSPVQSTIEVASDSGFSTIVGTSTLTGITTTFTLSVGTYYWRVKNEDGAGNISSYSTINQFAVL